MYHLWTLLLLVQIHIIHGAPLIMVEPPYLAYKYLSCRRVKNIILFSYSFRFNSNYIWDQHSNALGIGLPVSHAPLCIVTTNPSKTGLNTLTNVSMSTNYTTGWYKIIRAISSCVEFYICIYIFVAYHGVFIISVNLMSYIRTIYWFASRSFFMNACIFAICHLKFYI